MKKKHLIKALEQFGDEDEIVIGEDVASYVPKIRSVCGKGIEYMAYYCVRAPNHEGECYCSCKGVNFTPD